MWRRHPQGDRGGKREPSGAAGGSGSVLRCAHNTHAGTGKTLVARALAASASRAGRKVAFFMRKGADVLSKWVGEAERQLRLLFEEAARQQPAIIFFDEIDGLAPVPNPASPATEPLNHKLTVQSAIARPSQAVLPFLKERSWSACCMKDGGLNWCCLFGWV